MEQTTLCHWMIIINTLFASPKEFYSHIRHIQKRFFGVGAVEQDQDSCMLGMTVTLQTQLLHEFCEFILQLIGFNRIKHAITHIQ